MAVITPLLPIRELASRTSGGVEVRLLWNRRTDELRVCVADAHTAVYFELRAPRDKALEVFYHPYAYAARPRRAIDPTSAAAREPMRSMPRAA